jgi:hypothetical protein
MSFNWEIYSLLNPDLKKAGLTTKQQLEKHYRINGFKENRNTNLYQLYPDFNVTNYKNNYIDLCHMNNQQLEIHWLRNGRYENRQYNKNNCVTPNKINIVYAFIGILPTYTIDTIHQMRLFYDGPIYFIYNDYSNPVVSTLKNQYSVIMVNYDDVKHSEFNKTINDKIHKFAILPNLKGREKLFIYSFERFFLLYNLMCKKNINDVLFVELDNLIYDDPNNWYEQFIKKDMAYMFDNINRASSGIAYIKNTNILYSFLNMCLKYIIESNDFLNEMTVLYTFWDNNKERIQLLPIHCTANNYPSETHSTFSNYNSIFDAAGIGIYLGGLDPYHTDNKIVIGSKSEWSLIDYTKYKYKWLPDNKERKIPYMLYDSKIIKINNLHLHSKNLKPYMSK